MRPDAFPIIELQPASLRGVEQMGSKDKRWVVLPDDTQPWLFKFSRESAGAVTGEHWAEKLAAEVAELLGVSHARVELARLDGQWGSLSRKFDALAGPNVDLVHGNDLLAGFVTDYDPAKQRKQSDHSIANVLRAIGELFSDAAERRAALTMLAGYLVLDALILNTDRHHENWGVLRRMDAVSGVAHEIAPSFDHASSLARNEPPAKLAQWLAGPRGLVRGSGPRRFVLERARQQGRQPPATRDGRSAEVARILHTMAHPPGCVGSRGTEPLGGPDAQGGDGT